MCQQQSSRYLYHANRKAQSGVRVLSRIMLIFLILFCNFAWADTASNNENVKLVEEGRLILPAVMPPAWTKAKSTAYSQSCCKICTTGKACGNSCISRSYTCHQPIGCACNGGSSNNSSGSSNNSNSTSTDGSAQGYLTERLKLKHCNSFAVTKDTKLEIWSSYLTMLVGEKRYGGGASSSKTTIKPLFNDESLYSIKYYLTDLSGCDVSITKQAIKITLNKAKTSAKITARIDVSALANVNNKVKKVKGTYTINGSLPWSPDTPIFY